MVEEIVTAMISFLAVLNNVMNKQANFYVLNSTLIPKEMFIFELFNVYIQPTLVIVYQISQVFNLHELYFDNVSKNLQ